MARRILKRLQTARRVAVLWHEHPDGECVGSAIALAAALRLQGRWAEVLTVEPLPMRYRFLEVRASRRTLVRQLRPGEAAGADLAFVLDTTNPDRMAGVTSAMLGPIPLLNIDHHLSNRRFGGLNWVEPRAAATAELIWRLMAANRWRAPFVALEGLYAGLVTDTGQFSYSNTSPLALRMAAGLVEVGVDPEELWRKIYLEKSSGELELEARARERFEVWGGGKIAVISLSREDFAATRTAPENAQEFANIPRSLAGAELALFFYEVDGGRATKVSIRSLRTVNADALAARFGGGGHRQAAGCRLPMSLVPAKERFLPAALRAVGASHAAKKSRRLGGGETP
jgi:phosphoesterase RecJ-like protein